MPIQTYRCPHHGDFEVSMPFTEEVPQWSPCPFERGRAEQGRRYHGHSPGRCDAAAPWLPPRGVSFTIK